MEGQRSRRDPIDGARCAKCVKEVLDCLLFEGGAGKDVYRHAGAGHSDD